MGAKSETTRKAEAMMKIEGVCKEVIEKSEWVAIATAGPEGPHLAACWSHNVRALGIQDDRILIPAWRYWAPPETQKLEAPE